MAWSSCADHDRPHTDRPTADRPPPHAAKIQAIISTAPITVPSFVFNLEPQMPTIRSAEQVRLLRANILARVCTIPSCGQAPYAGLSYCHDHQIIKQKYGIAWAKNLLTQTARRGYICATRTHLAEQLRRGDITALSAVRELEGYLERHCYLGTLQPSDLGRRGISGDRKCRSILRAIHQRFNKDSELAALAILSAATGTILATKVEPKVERHLHYARAAVASCLWSMARIPTVTNSVCTYKPHRPHLAGRKLHEAVEKLVIEKYARWILTEQSTKAILKLVISHRYPKLDWWTWARNNRRNNNSNSSNHKGAVRSDSGKV